MPLSHRMALALVLAGALGACAAPGPQETLYCYKTLAQNDCYAQPQPGQDYRLTGIYRVPAQD